MKYILKSDGYIEYKHGGQLVSIGDEVEIEGHLIRPLKLNGEIYKKEFEEGFLKINGEKITIRSFLAVYNHPKGLGSIPCFLSSDEKLNLENIRKFEKQIKKELGFEKIIITNILPLEQ